MAVGLGSAVSRVVVALGRLLGLGALHYGCAITAVPLSECGGAAGLSRLNVGAEARAGVRQIEMFLSQQT